MANLQVRVDDKLKAQADALFASIGLDTSAAVRVFLKQSVLRGGIPFEDYAEVRGWMNEILDWLDSLHRPKVLAHIDSVATNFLFYPEGSGEALRLIDWEYAGMADPLLDIAMCAIYSYYTREQAERRFRAAERHPLLQEHLLLHFARW